MTPDVELMILAGGASSRFGSDKAFLQIEGKPVIPSLIERFKEAFPDSRSTVATSSEKVLLNGGPQVFDLYPGRGAWSGLHTALAYARSEWVFVLACDLPFVTADLFREIADGISTDVDAIVPLQPDERPQPLCALYRRSPCLDVADDVVTSSAGTPPLRAMFERVRTNFVPFDQLSHLDGSDRFFTNVNTPADLK